MPPNIKSTTSTSSSPPPPPMGTTLHHPTLNCSLRGTPSKTNYSIQFRNLKYASIPKRYEDSQPVNHLTQGPDGAYDATLFGPSCPQKRGAQAWDLSLVGEGVKLESEEGQGGTKGEKMDEFECLNLCVSVPSDVGGGASTSKEREQQAKKKKELLPVFVWIHGGGLSMGANNWPQYDIAGFVDRSVEVGKPVIGVAINYRVGIFGFLASQELGVEGNMGFKDQVLALRWVQRHIEGFGGDPRNVTAAGESAGGISLSVLLCADVGAGRERDEEEGLFKRVVVMSGDATLRKPRGRKWHEEMYREQIRFLGLEGLDVEARKKVLREMSAEELAEKLPLAQHFCAVVDGKWLKKEVTLSGMADGQRLEHKPKWCKEFVVGDTAHDGTILKGRILDSPHVFTNLRTCCFHHLTSHETKLLLSSYNLFPIPKDPSTAKHNLLLLATDLRFYLPSLAVSKGWKEAGKSARRYHFHIPNPVPGPFHRLSTHELDVTFLLQNFSGVFGEKDNQLGRQMADHFIGYVCGDGWGEEGKVVVFSEKGIESVSEEEYERVFRDSRGKVLVEIGYEKLWRMAEEWQRVRSDEEVVQWRQSRL